MAALSLSAACILCAAQPALSPAVAQWQPLITEAAARFDVPAPWIARVMEAESGGRAMRNGKPITSSAGAMGLMQIMPGTYAELRRRYEFGPDPCNPHDNIFAGAAYLKAMYRRYGYPLLFAAYQAGPARVDAWIFSGKPLPEATRAYLRRVVPGEILLSRRADSDAKSGKKSPNARTKTSAFIQLNLPSAARKSDPHMAVRPQKSTENSVFATPSSAAPLFVPLSSRNR